MSKIIERPEFTSYVLDFPFHLIKNETEAKNVSQLIGDKKIMHVLKFVDKKTYQPMLAFVIPEEGKDFSEWMKYVSKLELMINI